MKTEQGQLDVEIRRAAEALARATRVAVLTGAGVSAESGVPTFRASDGLWEGHRIEDVASPDGFDRDPRLVWNFYNARRANVARVQPNAGHLALANLERRFGNRFTLATQNVDGLHQAAGCRNVLEVPAACGARGVRVVGRSRIAHWKRCPPCRSARIAKTCSGPTSGGLGKCSRRTSGRKQSRRRSAVTCSSWSGRAPWFTRRPGSSSTPAG